MTTNTTTTNVTIGVGREPLIGELVPGTRVHRRVVVRPQLVVATLPCHPTQVVTLPRAWWARNALGDDVEVIHVPPAVAEALVARTQRVACRRCLTLYSVRPHTGDGDEYEIVFSVMGQLGLSRDIRPADRL